MIDPHRLRPGDLVLGEDGRVRRVFWEISPRRQAGCCDWFVIGLPTNDYPLDNITAVVDLERVSKIIHAMREVVHAATRSLEYDYRQILELLEWHEAVGLERGSLPMIGDRMEQLEKILEPMRLSDVQQRMVAYAIFGEAAFAG